MQNLKTLLALLLVGSPLAAAEACFRPLAKVGSIEFVVSKTQIALLEDNVQLTLPKDVTCERVVAALTRATSECVIAVHEQAMEAKHPFKQVLAKKGAQLKCGKITVPFTAFEAIVKPHEIPDMKAKRAARKASQAAKRLYPYDGRDIVGSTLEGDIKGYAAEFVKYHWGDLHPFDTYDGADTGVYHLHSGRVITADTPATKRESGDEIRIALTADWGAGTKESAYVAKLMVDRYRPHYTLHAGDVYYVGTEDEITANCLGVAPEGVANGVTWPHGSIGSFAMMGNHEMYSRAYGYFDKWLPTLGIKDATGKSRGQKASYSALENAYWRIVNIDTGYKTYSKVFESKHNDMPLPLVDWLRDVVKLGDTTDKRGIVLISHHQYFSAFGTPSLATPQQIAKLLAPNRTIVWLWGHEHRLSIYRLNEGYNGLPLNVYGRCIGNGGFPTAIDEQPAHSRETNLQAYDDRMYELQIGFKKVPVGFNGWVRLGFKRNKLSIDYYTLGLGKDGKLSDTISTHLLHEEFDAQLSGGLVQTAFKVLEKNMTLVNHLGPAPESAVE